MTVEIFSPGISSKQSGISTIQQFNIHCQALHTVTKCNVNALWIEKEHTRVLYQMLNTLRFGKFSVLGFSKTKHSSSAINMKIQQKNYSFTA